MSIIDDYKTLWVTRVGSHAWDMQRPDSDIDLYRVYIAPSEGLLLGHRHDRGHQARSVGEDGCDYDTSSFEIGHVIKQLMTGNLNHIIGLCSPIVDESSAEHGELVKIFRDNLASNCYKSIRGMAAHNFKRYFEDNPRTSLDEDEMKKKLGQVGRVLKFGVRLLSYHEISFGPYQPADRFEISGLMSELDDAYKNTTLPPTPEVLVYDDWLLGLRLNELGIRT